MKQLKNALIRSVGVVLFAFIPGMAVGGPSVGWFWGGIIGCATVFSSIIIFMGVQLAWDANITDADIEKGFPSPAPLRATRSGKGWLSHLPGRRAHASSLRGEGIL